MSLVWSINIRLWATSWLNSLGWRLWPQEAKNQAFSSKINLRAYCSSVIFLMFPPVDCELISFQIYYRFIQHANHRLKFFLGSLCTRYFSFFSWRETNSTSMCSRTCRRTISISSRFILFLLLKTNKAFSVKLKVTFCYSKCDLFKPTFSKQSRRQFVSYSRVLLICIFRFFILSAMYI